MRLTAPGPADTSLWIPLLCAARAAGVAGPVERYILYSGREYNNNNYILIEKNFDGTHNTQKRRWPQSGVPGASTTEAAGRPPHPWRRPAVRHGGGGASATEAAGRTVGLSHPRTYAVNVSVNVRSEIKLKRFAHRRTRQRPATPF